MVDVIESLRRHFGHASFRPGQGDVVRAVLEGASQKMLHG